MGLDAALLLYLAIPPATIACAIALWKLAKFFYKTGKLAEHVYTEFVPNHGGSLRDAIDRIEQNQGELYKAQIQHFEDDDGRFDQIFEALGIRDDKQEGQK
jgi:hypothetical protein